MTKARPVVRVMLSSSATAAVTTLSDSNRAIGETYLLSFFHNICARLYGIEVSVPFAPRISVRTIWQHNAGPFEMHGPSKPQQAFANARKLVFSISD
jgi:hypothetical protein